MVSNKKGVALIAVIITFYFAVILLLQAYIFHNVPSCRTSAAVRERGEGVDLHGFTVTSYCPGSCCNGIWAGVTATGKSFGYYRRMNINVAAVDPAVIPLGTLFSYEGRVYRAVDIGSLIRGKRIDLFVNTHRETLDFGVKRNQTIRILSTRTREAPHRGAGLNEYSHAGQPLNNHTLR